MRCPGGMEALAAATPVICTQLAGVGELVEDGVSGFLVPAGDADTLADRIIDMAELQLAGYPIKANDLTVEEWRDLARLKIWQQTRQR